MATGPTASDGYRVAIVEPPHVLVLTSHVDRDTGSPLQPDDDAARSLHVSWAFVLEDLGEDACRLTTRVRGRASPASFELIIGRVVMPAIHAVMERKQLREVKARAERDVAVGARR